MHFSIVLPQTLPKSDQLRNCQVATVMKKQASCKDVIAFDMHNNVMRMAKQTKVFAAPFTNFDCGERTSNHGSLKL